MSDEIEPALTPEQWEAALRHKTVLWPDGIQRVDDEPYQMAMKNFLLPDGHPQKFTRVDVELLREAADYIEAEDALNSLADSARVVAAKIAALLPPEAEFPKGEAKHMHEVKVMRDKLGNPRNPPIA